MLVARRLPALYVAAVAWAAGTVASEVLPIGLLARVVLVIVVVIALYAGTTAFVVFLACGRFGVVRTPRWRRQAATIAVAASFVWILIGAWHEGRTALNLGAIGAAELAGAALYLARRSVFAAVRRRVDVEP
jgi:hypothetical protein